MTAMLQRPSLALVDPGRLMGLLPVLPIKLLDSHMLDRPRVEAVDGDRVCLRVAAWPVEAACHTKQAFSMSLAAQMRLFVVVC